MDIFNSKNVHIQNKEQVKRTIENMVQGGREKLQVIADFDRTLSCDVDNQGKTCHTCYNAFDESSHLPDSYKERAKQVRDHYLAIEIDPNLTSEEKLPFMVEWWTKAHDLLLECHITKELVATIVKDARIILRDGCDVMFYELHKSAVPLLIFSAGVGNVIEEVLRRQYRVYDNMKIVSNFMDFDAQGKMVGFKGELIHVFNKNEAAMEHNEYFQNLSTRENILLLGDSLGDLNMATGCVNSKNVLKIGFLNHHVDELLERYKASFDIVLVDDATMNVANAILSSIP